MKPKKDSSAPILIAFITSGIIFSFAVGFIHDCNVSPSGYRGTLKSYKNLFKGKPATTKSSDSTDTSSKEYNCDWPSELLSKGKAYRCANSSGCPHGCYRGKWVKYGYSSPKECAKAAMACLNKRCGHLCK